MADKLRATQQLEQLQARYVGTGHADTTKLYQLPFPIALHFKTNKTSEWVSNVHRDTYASYIGHPPLLEYMSVATGEPMAKMRTAFIEVSLVLPGRRGIGTLIGVENDPAGWEAAREGGLGCLFLFLSKT